MLNKMSKNTINKNTPAVTNENTDKPKVGIVDVGGGLRGIYGSGVLDRCMDKGIRFDHCYGVSAGAANMVSYLAGQTRRNLVFYMVYAFRDEYMSMHNFVRHQNYIDLDYVYGTLTNAGGENPLDYKAMMANPAGLTVVGSNARTGEVRYFDKSEIPQNDYSILKATCAIPVVCKPQQVGENYYFDGGLGDPVPVKYAMENGCDKVVLVLTKPRDCMRASRQDQQFARVMKRRYPQAARNLSLRALRYNKSVRYAQQLEKEGKVLIIAPDNIEGMKTLTKDKSVLMDLYLKGYKDAAEIEAFMNV
jgi:predicted patatin/cPLA2 family phospholipase